ncbi:hypothetical protein F4825DRAFT_400787 [Nemania diffusa]|nr:hypothetical protein F4825DRAFT_400787 [Nemania diffusa]
MNQFPQCTRSQQGYPCYCPSCMHRMMLANQGIPLNQEQSQLGMVGSDRDLIYSGDVPAYHQNYGEGAGVHGLSVPMEPRGNLLPNGYVAGNTNSLAPQGITSFSNINMRHQGTSPGTFLGSLGENQRSTSLGAPPRQGQQSHRTTAEPSPAASDQHPSQGRPPTKRKAKYSEEPPQSIYGPPFTTRNITATMDPDEVRECNEYNEAVSKAHKDFLRYKNNIAAKKSRDRKQTLIDELTAEKRRLVLRIKQLEEAARRAGGSSGGRGSGELVDANARLQGENEKLRKENEALRGQVDQLTRRLSVLEAQQQADGGASVDADMEISQFLAEFNQGHDGSSDWAGPDFT